MRDFLRIFDQQNLAANILALRKCSFRQEPLRSFHIRMEQHLVLPMGVIGFFQRIPIVLRFAHFLILFPAEVGVGRGQLGEKLKQAVRIDAVIVVFYLGASRAVLSRTYRSPFRKELLLRRTERRISHHA